MNDSRAAAFPDDVDLLELAYGPLCQLGEALLRSERWADAGVVYERAVTLEPDRASAHSSLGRACFNAGRWEAAVSAWQRAVELAPASSRGHHDLGDALLKLRRLDEATTAFQTADELFPGWSRRDVRTVVARAERWVERLTPAPGTAATDNPTALFVLDNDYGELTTTMCLLLGQDLATRTTLLLPPRLYVTNKDALPGRTHPYTSLDDVMSRVDAERPQVVFLCSAYLYALHGLFPCDALQRLVQLLGRRGCRVVTSDPFLGLLSNLGGSTTVSVDIPKDAPPPLQHAKDAEDERLNRLLAESARIVQALPHLYPASPVPSDRDAVLDSRRVSFFNPELVYPSQMPTERGRGLSPDPLWLFILSSRDYELELIHHGRDAFVESTVGKFEQALEAGRHPVFVGPYDCVRALLRNMTAAGRRCVLDGVTLSTFCPFKRFSALLLSAEYVFYWNVLSHSMFLRLANELPVFLFDRGHLVRNVIPLYGRIVDWYYQGWDPIYLDPGQELRVEHLGRLADQYRTAAREITAHWRRSPSPEQMIDRLSR